MQTIAAQALQSVDAEPAEDILKLGAPAAEQVSGAPRADFRVDALGQAEVRSADAPGAFAGMALLADMTAQRDKGGRTDIDGIGAQSNRLSDIAAAAETAGDDDRSQMAYAFLP